ncbi:hypothetical protein BDV36DRAFT_306166 [Aspergillus pseudocaelatus]|uniref:Uncharacterized protein n=1 Tax=Aspergillus pseudocaelatus TaxID=1825620 RepID=A0ABQ6X5Z8_9EURO|nr:hypothetical protein BDV36DRAFT_306166 [Aspergillus pseudocaelatus]
MFHILNFVQSLGACFTKSARKPRTAIEATNEILAQQMVLPSPSSISDAAWKPTGEVVIQKYTTREEKEVIDIIEAEMKWGISFFRDYSGYKIEDHKGRPDNHLSDTKVVSSKRKGKSFEVQPLKKQKSSNLLQTPTGDHPMEALFDTKSPTDQTPGDKDITVPDPEETGDQELSLKDAIKLARDAADKMKELKKEL